jgi:hypothetical protein
VNRYVSTADEEEQSEEDEDSEEDEEADAKGKFSMMSLGRCAIHHQHSCITSPQSIYAILTESQVVKLLNETYADHII